MLRLTPHTFHSNICISIYIYVFVQIRRSLRYCVFLNVGWFAEKAINFVAHGKLFATLIKPKEEKQNTRKRLIDANRRVVASSSVYIKSIAQAESNTSWLEIRATLAHTHTNTSASHIRFAYQHKRITYLCLIQWSLLRLWRGEIISSVWIMEMRTTDKLTETVCFYFLRETLRSLKRQD